MKKALLILGVVVALAFSGCSLFYGDDGAITGKFSYSSYITNWKVFSLGGFPDGTLYPNTGYTISPGTYSVKYAVIANKTGTYYYWPGNSSGTGSTYDYSPYYCWNATYTVTANEGSLFENGADKSFELYLNYSEGLQLVSGDATVSSSTVHTNREASALPSLDRDIAPTTTSWTSKDGSVTVTITNELKRMTAEEAALLGAQSVK